MSFKKGDRVRFKDEAGEGIFLELLGKGMAKIMLPEGIEVPYPLNQLVKVEFDATDLQISVSSSSIALSKKDYPGKAKRAQKAPGLIIPEVDLHIGSLVDRQRGLSNGEMLTIQLRHFQFWMEKAIRDNLPKVIFIHGVGEGVLKAEIRRQVAAYPGVYWQDAPYHRYGFGATEVIIR